MRKIAAIIVMALMMTVVAGHAALAWGDWKTLKTEHFTVFYKPELEKPAQEVLRLLEYHRPRLQELLGNEMFHLPLVIEDVGEANGNADPLYRTVHLYITPPPFDSGLGTYRNWMELVGTHETTHMLSLSKSGGAVNYLRKVFGNLILPNDLTPGWIIEGITVYSESHFSAFQGRLNDGYYDAYLGACVSEGRFPGIDQGTFAPTKFPFDISYLCGGEFMHYLANTYGEDKFAKFFAVNGSSLLSIIPGEFVPAAGIDRSARAIFGKSFKALWNDWENAEKIRFKDFHMEGERVTRRGWYVTGDAFYQGKLYYKYEGCIQSAKGTYIRSEIAAYDPAEGTERTVVSTTAPIAMPLRFYDGKLYYAVNELKPGYANASQQSFGTYQVLHQRDLKTGTDRAIMKDRMCAFTVLSDGRILYAQDRVGEDGSNVLIFDPKSGSHHQLYTTQALIEELASDGEQLVAVIRQAWSNTGIYRMNLTNGSFTTLVDTEYGEGTVSLNGGRLFYSSNYGQVYSAYMYDLETGKISRLTKNGFAVSPALDAERNQLYFIGMTSDGHDIYRIAPHGEDFRPVAAAEGLAVEPIPDLPELSDLHVTKGGYGDDLKTLSPKLWMPSYSGSTDGDDQVFGATVMGQDAIGDFSYSASLGYNTDDDRWMYDLSLGTTFFAPWSITLQTGRDDDSTMHMLDIAYPLVVRNSPGLANLTAGVALVHDTDYIDDLYIVPHVDMAFHYPSVNFFGQFRPVVNHDGFDGTVGGSALVFGGDLTATVHYMDAPYRRDSVFEDYGIRGYDDELNGKKGWLGSVEYSHTLYAIQKGVWNPCFFMDRVYGTIFWDRAHINADTKQNSYGLELHLASTWGLSALLPIDAGVRYTWAQDSDDDGLGFFFGVGVPVF